MMGLNPLQMMWEYVTFQWGIKPRAKDILAYPFMAIVCFFILGFVVIYYLAWHSIYYIIKKLKREKDSDIFGN